MNSCNTGYPAPRVDAAFTSLFSQLGTFCNIVSQTGNINTLHVNRLIADRIDGICETVDACLASDCSAILDCIAANCSVVRSCVPICSNVFIVSEQGGTDYSTINEAISAALAAGHDSANPAIIQICPGNPTSPYPEDVIIPPGFYVTGVAGDGPGTTVTGTWTFDTTGFPPPPSLLLGNFTTITGILFASTTTTLPSITVTGSESGTYEFHSCAIVSLGMTTSSLVNSGITSVCLIDSIVGNFGGGPAISVTSPAGFQTRTTRILSPAPGGIGISLASTATEVRIHDSAFIFGADIGIAADGGEIHLRDSFIVGGTTAGVHATSTMGPLAELNIFNCSVFSFGGTGFLQNASISGAFGLIASTFLGASFAIDMSPIGGTGAANVSCCQLTSFAGAGLRISPSSGRHIYSNCLIIGASATVPTVDLVDQVGGDSMELNGCQVLQVGPGAAPTALKIDGNFIIRNCSIESSGVCMDIGSATGPASRAVSIFNSSMVCAAPPGFTGPCVNVDASMGSNGGDGITIIGGTVSKTISGTPLGQTILNAGRAPLRFYQTSILGGGTLFAIESTGSTNIECRNCFIQNRYGDPTVSPTGGIGYGHTAASLGTGSLNIYNSSIDAVGTAPGGSNAAINITGTPAAGVITILNSTLESATDCIQNINDNGASLLTVNVFNSQLLNPIGGFLLFEYGSGGGSGGTVNMNGNYFSNGAGIPIASASISGTLNTNNTGAGPGTVFDSAVPIGSLGTIAASVTVGTFPSITYP